MSGLSDDTVADISDAISVFDTKGDGKLEISRLLDCLRALGLNPNSRDWSKEISEFKKAGKYRLNIDEFAYFYKEEAVKQQASIIELSQSLKALDPVCGELGVIDRVEMKHHLTMIGDKLTEREADIILDAVAEMNNDERASEKGITIQKLIKFVSYGVHDNS